MNRIKFFLIILCAVLKLSANETSQLIAPPQLSKISKESLNQINVLFRELFKMDVFGYTLLGDKPISISGEPLQSIAGYDEKIWVQQPKDSIELYNFCRDVLEPCEATKLKDPWQIWKKNCPKVDFGNYLFLTKSFRLYTWIFLINKAAFIKVVNKNIDLFRKWIDKDITAEMLLAQIADETTTFEEIFKVHVDAQLGILLGFGRHNSLLFEKYAEIYDTPNFVITMRGLEDYKKRIYSQVKGFYDPTSFFYVSAFNRVGFMADHSHPETKSLKKKYDALIPKLDDIYLRDDWFEVTLEKLVGNENG